MTKNNMPKQPTPSVPASSLNYLKELKKNNNREWFQLHKDRFLREQVYIEKFATALLSELHTHDAIETISGKGSLHRIYRDTRFSKDKTPYKHNWSGSFKRATQYRRGGYYFHIEPGNNYIAGGFYGPNPEDLKRIREDIAFDQAPLLAILGSRSFKTTFGTLQGEQVKTSPKGFDSDHEAIELLRYKQFLLIKQFSDEEVMSPSFIKKVNLAFRNMRPFFDYMSEVLSMDKNGLPFS